MNNKAFLYHIHEETRFLLHLCEQMDIGVIISDPITSRAVRTSLETIGEAAKNLSPSLRDSTPEIYWRGIIGMRDRLIHHYFGIDWDMISEVLQDEIPVLDEAIDKLIKFLEENESDLPKECGNSI